MLKISTMMVVAFVVVFFTLTDRASTIPINIRSCQSGTWSPRGAKVNGSHHHGDNPLLRPTGPGIQIATKSNATLQAMAPTNIKTVTPYIYREQPRSTWIVVAYPRPAFSATKRTNYVPTSFDQQVQVSQGHTSYKKKKNEIPRSMVVKVLSWRSRRASQHPAVQSPVHP